MWYYIIVRVKFSGRKMALEGVQVVVISSFWYYIRLSYYQLRDAKSRGRNSHPWVNSKLIVLLQQTCRGEACRKSLSNLTITFVLPIISAPASIEKFSKINRHCFH